jgi:hypothetical protein
MLAAPAAALDVKGEVARQLCLTPGGKPDEVVVCGRRKVEQRYRMPDRDGPFDPAGPTESVAREHMRWGEGGEAGTQSCGSVGPGGWTGCLVREWDRQRAQTQYGKNVPRGW